MHGDLRSPGGARCAGAGAGVWACVAKCNSGWTVNHFQSASPSRERGWTVIHFQFHVPYAMAFGGGQLNKFLFSTQRYSGVDS